MPSLYLGHRVRSNIPPRNLELSDEVLLFEPRSTTEATNLAAQHIQSCSRFCRISQRHPREIPRAAALKFRLARSFVSDTFRAMNIAGSKNALVLVSLLTLFLFDGRSAQADTVTWTGNSSTSSEWSDAANWTPNRPVSGDDLIFGASARTNTVLSYPQFGFQSLSSLTLSAAAPDYTISTNTNLLQFEGAGIINNSPSSNLTIINRGDVRFRNSSSAGSAILRNPVADFNVSILAFEGMSNAGTASISLEGGNSLNGGSLLNFQGLFSTKCYNRV